MKSKTKKLFLSLFAFASLAITACSGNNGGSSGAGDSSGSVTTSSESSSGSNTSTTSEADVDTNLYVKVDNGEEQAIAYDEDEGTYTIGPVELTTSQVIEIYIKEDGVKQSALDIIDVETGSAAYLDVDEDEGTVSVTSDGTYTFVFTYDDGELSLAITKEADPSQEGYAVKINNEFKALVVASIDTTGEEDVTEKYKIENLSLSANDEVSFYKDGVVLAVLSDKEDSTNVNNINEHSVSEDTTTPFTIHNDATVGIYFKHRVGTDPAPYDGWRFWITGYQGGAPIPTTGVVTATVAGNPLNMTKKVTPDSGKAESWESDSVDLVKDQAIVISVDGTPVQLWREGETATSISNVNERPSESKVDQVTVHNNADAEKVYVHKNNDGSYGIWVTGYEADTPEPSTAFASTYKAAYGTIGSSDATWGWDGAATGSTLADPLYSDQAKYTITVTEGQAFKLRPEEDLGTWYGFDELEGSYAFASEGADKNVVLKAGTYDIYLKQLKSDSSIKIGLYKQGTNVTIAFDSGTIGSFVGSNHLYAWAWGSDYGSGILVPANGSTNIVLKDNATGFKLLTTAEAVAEEDYDDYPTSPAKEGNDISVIKEGTLVYNSGTNKFNYDGDVIEDITLTFTNNKNFTNVKCYVYGSSGETAAWPGENVTYKGKNDYNEDQYTILIAGDTDFVIFNGTGGQTVNIVISELGTDRTIYCLNETDSSGHYLVGHTA